MACQPARGLQYLLLVCLLSTAVAARQLQQSYDCSFAEQQCKKASCKGRIKFDCDPATGKTECLCESTGLASCFPGSASVATAGGGAKQLSQLELGDSVLSVGADGHLQFSPVYMFTSQRPDERATFLRLHTSAGLNITVTPGHYLFAWSSAAAAEAALPTPASWPYVLPTQLKVGDFVPVAAAGSSSGRSTVARVTSIEQVQEVGVYMPHTLTGAIVVDGVVASELTSIVPPALAGPTFQRSMAAALRLAFAALPPYVVEAAAKGISAWAHGTADAAISYQAFTSAASAA